MFSRLATLISIVQFAQVQFMPWILFDANLFPILTFNSTKSRKGISSEEVSLMTVMNLAGLTFLQTQCSERIPPQCKSSLDNVQSFRHHKNYLDVHTLNKVSNVQCMTSANVQLFCRGFRSGA